MHACLHKPHVNLWLVTSLSILRFSDFDPQERNSASVWKSGSVWVNKRNSTETVKAELKYYHLGHYLPVFTFLYSQSIHVNWQFHVLPAYLNRFLCTKKHIDMKSVAIFWTIRHVSFLLPSGCPNAYKKSKIFLVRKSRSHQTKPTKLIINWVKWEITDRSNINVLL